MKKFIAIFAVLLLALSLSACGKGTYEEGYEAGYKEGLMNGYQTGLETGHDAGFYDGYLAAGGTKADAILAKYGVTQVRGSENNAPTTGEDYPTFEEWSNAKHATEGAAPTLTIQPEPASRTILSGNEYYGSEITVTASGDYSYVVSLKNSQGTHRLSFFVRAGETVTIGVPAEYLYVYFASGTTWYGYGEGLMFGEYTSYSKDDDLLDFAQYTYQYTLYPVYDGNFSETPSDENEFFE